MGRIHQQDDDRLEEAIHFGRQEECWEVGKSVGRKMGVVRRKVIGNWFLAGMVAEIDAKAKS